MPPHAQPTTARFVGALGDKYYKRFRPLAPVLIGLLAMFLVANRREAQRGLGEPLGGGRATRAVLMPRSGEAQGWAGLTRDDRPAGR